MQLCFSSFLIFSCYHSIISCCKMTTIPPLPSLYPSFPQLIFLLSHFPFCVWYLVFVCAVNTLENEPETFSSLVLILHINTHRYCISHTLFQDQHLFPLSPFRQQHHSDRCASFTSFSPSVPLSFTYLWV